MLDQHYSNRMSFLSINVTLYMVNVDYEAGG